MKKSILFVGGPLHGQTLAIDVETRTYFSMEPLRAPARATDFPLDPSMDVREVVYYRKSVVVAYEGYLGPVVEKANVMAVREASEIDVMAAVLARSVWQRTRVSWGLG